MATKIPRSEYPRPQMVRNNWMNLNGYWQFQFDWGRSGRNCDMMNRERLEKQILVPFCPESKLSGICYTDFIPACWYARKFTLNAAQLNGRVLLHFEAVNYECQVWVNGQSVGTHWGGYTPFTLDITKQVREGDNALSVYVENDVRNPLQPRGKQSEILQSHGCDYTRCTGIWQTVWLEFVPNTYIENYRCTPDGENDSVQFEVFFGGAPTRKHLQVSVTYDGKHMGGAHINADGNTVRFAVELAEKHLWEPLDPKLYDLKISMFTENSCNDSITGYFGLRNVAWTDKGVLINGKPVFQRLVLDQGYYPDGIYTAPSDDALRRDIQLSLDLGYNGARMHEKVFERRYLYWADRMGYMVWGEYGNWGLDVSQTAALKSYVEPWLESIRRDYNSPALVGWCPFNETWDRCGRRQDNGVLSAVYFITKAVDPTRPVIDTSGHYHVVTDIFDVHDYEQNVEVFASHYAPMAQGGQVYNNFPDRQSYSGQPYMVSEYGGIKWNEQNSGGWGYGNAPKTVEEFVERYVGLTRVLLQNPRICGLCYTQLYDVEQEQNGIYTYSRQSKFSPIVMEQLRAAMVEKAAIEE